MKDTKLKKVKVEVSIKEDSGLTVDEEELAQGLRAIANKLEGGQVMGGLNTKNITGHFKMVGKNE